MDIKKFTTTYLKTLKAKFRDGKIYSNGYNEYLFISSDREMFYDNAKDILSSLDEATKKDFEEMKKRYINRYCYEQ